MSVLKPRKRLVYFRLSEDEFNQFNQICTEGRARSVSDLARHAVRELMKCESKSGLERQVEELNQLLHELRETITVFEAALHRMQPPVKE